MKSKHVNVCVHKHFPPIFSMVLATGRESAVSTSSDNLFGFCGAAQRGRDLSFCIPMTPWLAPQPPASRQNLGIPVIRSPLNFKSRGKT